MASGLLALIDDIATLLDDVAILTKVAAKKTAGVLGDDLALNADQVSGVRAERELPVVWAVAKGSFINKLILVPSALAISAFLPWLISPLLMVGGLYLCFEGIEKIFHKFVHHPEKHREHAEKLKAVANENVDLVAFERQKIKGAIRTDFILSAEIIVISLGTVQAVSFATRAAVVSTLALVVTVGVYGLVAAIVKLDDAGLYLLRNSPAGSVKHFIGKSVLLVAPKFMKLLSVLGTVAMFLVGGGILVHGIGILHHGQQWLARAMESLPGGLQIVLDSLYSGVIGMIAGALSLVAVSVVQKLFAKSRAV